jgi:CDP-6-deoxy-D-xylo-4-hexulose-3-dehydrase
VLDVAKRHDLWIVEDTCEGLGVRYDGRCVGTFGTIGTYSFYFSHHITTIEGGMVVTNDGDIAELARAMRAHGWVRHLQNPERYVSAHPEIDPRYLFFTTGFNLRPTEINAALGLEQLKRLEGFNERRRAVNARLLAALAPQIHNGDLVPMRVSQRVEAAPFGQTMLCRSRSVRDAFRDFLEQNGIETRPIICGNMARQPALAHLRHRVSGALSGADRVMDCGLYWGTHPMMSDEQVDYIISVVRRFFQ